MSEADNWNKLLSQIDTAMLGTWLDNLLARELGLRRGTILDGGTMSNYSNRDELVRALLRYEALEGRRELGVIVRQMGPGVEETLLSTRVITRDWTKVEKKRKN